MIRILNLVYKFIRTILRKILFPKFNSNYYYLTKNKIYRAPSLRQISIIRQFAKEEWNPLSFRIVKKVLEIVSANNPIILDIGANVGYYAIVYSKLLNKYGGLWSDIDILYTKPMCELPENTLENNHIDTALCPLMGAKKHTVGFLLSSKKNNFFQFISRLARKQYTPTLYQCMGSDLINSRFETFESLQKRFRKNNFLFLEKNCVYSITSKEIEMFYQDVDRFVQKKLNSKDTVGFHWFAGHPQSQQFENTLTQHNVGEYNNLLSTIIKEISVETCS
jgi:hypothetical protein